MKVLIIGGYGTFGFGMAERLSDEAGLELILAGRNFEKAKAACDRLSGAATFTPLKLCLLYTSPSPRDATLSRMPSSA